MRRKSIIAAVVIGSIVILGLMMYAAIPAGRLRITSIDLVRNFSETNEGFLDETGVGDLMDALHDCTIWRTFRSDFPKVYGTDCDVLMTGMIGGEIVGVQMIFTTSGDIYFRIGDKAQIYTSYSSSIKDALRTIFFDHTQKRRICLTLKNN